jgi:hypothetical protein
VCTCCSNTAVTCSRWRGGDYVLALAVGGDGGRWLFSGSDDKTVRSQRIRYVQTTLTKVTGAPVAPPVDPR